MIAKSLRRGTYDIIEVIGNMERIAMISITSINAPPEYVKSLGSDSKRTQNSFLVPANCTMGALNECKKYNRQTSMN